jgi:adenosylcobinamide kinase / adenosylcobinamide-phosphate guanylyltransferase
MLNHDQGKLVLLLGGARSGKSDFAERLAQTWSDRVIYVATAVAGDEEMAQRVVAHRARRPAHWHTVEAPSSIAAALEPKLAGGELVLLDCLTLLTSNLLIAEQDPSQAESRLAGELDDLLAICRRRQAALIIVSNEVGQGLVPTYALGRQYRDVLGRANQRLAALADHVLYFVAGMPLDLKALSRQCLHDLGLESDHDS